MTSNIAVVGDRDTVTGFRLGGVREATSLKHLKRQRKP